MYSLVRLGKFLFDFKVRSYCVCFLYFLSVVHLLGSVGILLNYFNLATCANGMSQVRNYGHITLNYTDFQLYLQVFFKKLTTSIFLDCVLRLKYKTKANRTMACNQRTPLPNRSVKDKYRAELVVESFYSRQKSSDQLFVFDFDFDHSLENGWDPTVEVQPIE